MVLVTSYHNLAFKHTLRARAVERVVQVLSSYDQKIGIVCTGLSGILVGVPVAERTNREFAIVRKPGECSHGNTVEGYELTEYVIVDDFIDSGHTIERIIDVMDNAVCKGILLYNERNPASRCFAFKEQVIPVIHVTLYE